MNGHAKDFVRGLVFLTEEQGVWEMPYLLYVSTASRQQPDLITAFHYVQYLLTRKH